MALVKCKECGSQISSKAEACPQCGAKRAKPVKVFSGAGYTIIGIIVFAFFFKACSPRDTPAPAPPPVAVEAATPAQVPGTAAVKPTLAEWEYADSTDKMRGAKSKYAKVQSLNTIELEFPYNRVSNHGYIGLQDVPGQGKGIYLEVDKGQFDCNIYSCALTIKFDSGPVKKMSANRAGAGASHVVFLPYATTLPQLLKAKHVTIEATFYGSGSRQLEFDVAGLRWP